MKHSIFIEVFFFLAIGAFSTVHAQQFNTNQSIRQQLKEGTVPGLLFAPKPQVAHVDTATQNQIKGENFGLLYKSGKLPGVQYAPSQPITNSTKPKVQNNAANGNTQLPK